MNYSDIKTKYDSLDTMWPNPSDAMNTGKKFESPAMYSIRAATKALMADTTPGAKYIILVTDGQEDYCDDALEICASDSTVGALQAAYTADVKTIVFGLQTMQFNLPAVRPPGVRERRRGRDDRAGPCPASTRRRYSTSAGRHAVEDGI